MDLDADELVDLAERLHAIGVVEFSYGPIAVKFSGTFAIPGTAVAPPTAKAYTPKTTRQIIEERWGETKFPGNG
jgi:hypothetical protein